MCSHTVIEFGKDFILAEEVKGKRVIEVGSYNINGSLRSIVEPFGPQYYVGIDIAKGPGVDAICGAEEVLDKYGKESFDLVICTEVVEHVRNWRKVFSNLKNLLKSNGALILTTRSKGFPFHSHPDDFWRYEVEDMKVLFSDMNIEVVASDPKEPGVFLKARRTNAFKENRHNDYALYSMTKLRRCRDNDFQILLFKLGKMLRRLLSRFRRLMAIILPVQVKLPEFHLEIIHYISFPSSKVCGRWS